MLDPAKDGTKISSIHITVVILSLSMTLGAWFYAKQQAEKQVEARFEQAATNVVGLIEDRMSRYEDALWSGVAMIDTNENEEVTHNEWRTFSESLQLEERYPGVNGIGVIYHVEKDGLAAFQDAQVARGREFSVYPEHPQDFSLPITFIEPEGINAAAVGLDVAHETNRREALLASRDTGEARITGPIILVQDNGHTPGFLFYTPFYDGMRPETLDERREAFRGVVYAPFVVRNLVAGLLAQDLRSVDFSIRDGDQIIYDEHSADDSNIDSDPMFAESIEIGLYGRSWIVDIRTNLKFRAENANQQPTLILAAGLLIEALVITLIVLLIRSNQKARDYANDLTLDLREKTEKLELANREIEQFVYIASHDLKTPTRGISFLTDFLEEEIVEQFGPIPENSEIKSNLYQIRERLERMNALTADIMEYSRLNSDPNTRNSEVEINLIIDNCVADFQIRRDQIRLSSELKTISCDGNTFRRVLENLVGNAFKYHPDRETALVDIAITENVGRLLVSVKDNGQGIDPRFHGKIFDVFQTLQSSNTSDSTGIGLAIVKKAVESHGGNITVSSALGEGSDFKFDWPIAHPVNATHFDEVA